MRYEKCGRFVHITYRGRMRRTAVISGESEKCRTVLPLRIKCEGDCPVTLTQLALDYSGGAFGMCYVVRLPDSSFIIIDGGQIRVKNGYPKRLNYFNEASTAFRITSGGGSVLITGDIYKEASTILVNRYPTALKSDIVQVAHHGNQGATKAFYQAVQASTALWPCAQDYGSDSLEALIRRQNEVGAIDRYVYESISKTEQFTAEDYSVELKLPYVHGSR